jgi:mannitol/fructose-specific phosphotransferase system IIA component (Ntr-type)
MNPTELLPAKAVSFDFPNGMALTKKDIIRHLSIRFQECYELTEMQRQNAAGAMHYREAQASTGLERHVALPHGTTESVQRILSVLVVSRKAVPFEALGGKSIHFFLSAVYPNEHTSAAIRYLSHIMRILQSDDVAREVLRAQSPEVALAFIMEHAKTIGDV